MLDLVWNQEAWADMLPAGSLTEVAGQQPPMWMQLAPMGLIFVVFYFLAIAPQKKQLKEQEKLQKDLAQGDFVITHSGIIGKVIGLSDTVMTLELAERVRMKMLRTQVAKKADPAMLAET
jgi:preprotein translocase subunit YajC